MPSLPNTIPPEHLDEILYKGEQVHVVHKHPAASESEEVMAREAALAHLKNNGAFFAGPLAQSANHAICSPSGGGWAFYESNHE